MSNIVDDATGRALRAALDGLSRRQQAINQNIANVDTPGYRAVGVTFEQRLKRQLRAGDVGGDVEIAATQPFHFSDLDAPAAVRTYQLAGDTAMRNDGNTVDVDAEMARLAETTIAYSAAARLLSARMSLMRSIVNDGRR